MTEQRDVVIMAGTVSGAVAVNDPQDDTTPEPGGFSVNDPGLVRALNRDIALLAPGEDSPEGDIDPLGPRGRAEPEA